MFKRIVIALALAGCSFAEETPRAPEVVEARAPDAHFGERLLVVTAEGWNETLATMHRFERNGAAWRAVGRPLPVTLGRSGLGMGRGLHGDTLRFDRAPEKREGDGRSPAGFFAVRRQLAYAGLDDVERIADITRCVEDGESAQYGRVLDATDAEVTWNGAENMLRPDGLYERVLVVEHNTDAPVAGGGSCIFFHVWRAGDVPTAGCTAMSRETLEDVARWVSDGATLVQLPRAEYDAVRAPWRLPTLEGTPSRRTTAPTLSRAQEPVRVTTADVRHALARIAFERSTFLEGDALHDELDRVAAFVEERLDNLAVAPTWAGYRDLLHSVARLQALAAAAEPGTFGRAAELEARFIEGWTRVAVP